MTTFFLACKHDTFFRAVESLLLKGFIKINGGSKKCLSAAEDFANNPSDVVLLDAQWGGDEFTSRKILQELVIIDPLVKIILFTTFLRKNYCRKEQAK